MQLPLLEVGSSLVHPTTKLLLMQRDHGLLSGFLKPLMLASACNNQVSVFCDQSRYMRQLVLWLRAKAADSKRAKDLERPVMRSLEASAADAALYAAKYASKPEGVAENEGMLGALDSVVENAANRSRSDQARLLVTKALNAAQRSITVPSTLASFWTLYKTDHFISHKTVPHNYAVHAARVLATPDEPVVVQHQLVELPGAEDGPDADLIRLVGQEEYDANMADSTASAAPSSPPPVKPQTSRQGVVSAVTDYTYRSRQLSEWSPWLMAMFCRREKLTSAHQQWAFEVPHAQAGTHGLVPHPQQSIVLPRAICTVPVRPAAAALLPEKDAYAAFVLGNFASDRAVDGVPAYGAAVGEDTAPGTLWQRMQDWFTDPSCHLLSVPAAIVLENIDSLRRTQVRTEQTAQSHKQRKGGVKIEDVLNPGAGQKAGARVEEECDSFIVDEGEEEQQRLPRTTCDADPDDGSAHAAEVHAAVQDVDGAGMAYDKLAFGGVPSFITGWGVHVTEGSVVQCANVDRTIRQLKAKYKDRSRQHRTPQLPPHLQSRKGVVELIKAIQDSKPQQAVPFVAQAYLGISAEQMAQLLQLDDDGQKAAFYTVAATLQAELEHRRDPDKVPPPPQLRMAMFGGPGVGKSTVLKAMELFCANQNEQGLFTKAAQSWRACEGMRSPLSAAHSTYWTFKLQLNHRARKEGESIAHVQQQVGRPVVFACLDECSFFCTAHLSGIDQSSQQAMKPIEGQPRRTEVCMFML
jgi:hypothetical protein